jgi:cysteine desulfurase/selenocysteine lyase
MSTTLQDLRAEFPALAGGLCFLDWGATGLLARSVRAALTSYLDELESCPSGESTWMHTRHHETREAARRELGALLNAPANSIGLLESTTAGLNAAVSSIRLQKGENVLLAANDYLAVATPWKHRAARDQIELRWVAPREGCIEVEDLVAALDERTRVIAISTVGWTTGALLDLERLSVEARSRGIMLVIDAIQTFGVVPLDLEATPVAFLAVGGHKWLNSTLGAGFLYVHPNIAARHQPPYLGFLSGRAPRGNWGDWFADPRSRPDETIVFPNCGRSFETGGTPSYVGAIGLLENARLLRAVGPEVIARQVRQLGRTLMAGLDSLGLAVVTPKEERRRGGIVVFSAPGGPEQEATWIQALRAQRIIVSRRYCAGVGGIRVSIHGMNTAEDIARLLSALRSLRD